MVSLCTIILDSCKIVSIVGNNKINEKKCVLTHVKVVAWSIGTNDMTGLGVRFTQTQMSSYLD